MTTTAIKPLSIKACYIKAWTSFAKWWIPICLISGFLMVFEWIPKQFAKAESHAMRQSINEIVAAFNQGNLDRLEVLATQLNTAAMAFATKLVTFSLYAAPFAVLLTVLLLATSLMAVKNQRTRYAPKRIVEVALVNVVLAIVTTVLLFVLFPLGVYVYVKLIFVSLLMLEDGKSPTSAIRESWRMTNGNFWPLFNLAAINTSLQVAMVPTVVGLIPATGFANTARAAAFTMLRSARSDPA